MLYKKNLSPDIYLKVKSLKDNIKGYHIDIPKILVQSICKSFPNLTYFPSFFFFPFQRRWQLWSDNNDKSNSSSHGQSGVETARHLQILLRNWCRVLSLRRADMFHEVRILDLRWLHGELGIWWRGWPRSHHPKGGNSWQLWPRTDYPPAHQSKSKQNKTQYEAAWFYLTEC